MAKLDRQVYVISDLHLGGEHNGDRDFRMCTETKKLAEFIQALVSNKAQDKKRIGRKVSVPQVELVINGDFVDFLAEEDPKPDSWTAFKPDPDKAKDLLLKIASRDGEKQIFDGLKNLLKEGARLTIILGNHDLELSFPRVRDALSHIVQAEGQRFSIIYDGEAYPVGEALIDHGHRRDEWNRVDQGDLLDVRAFLSRLIRVPPQPKFDPPAGSSLVTEVMNPIKKKYAFVDLLKPEKEAVVPILLALEPNLFLKVYKVAPMAFKTRLSSWFQGLFSTRRGVMAEEAFSNVFTGPGSRDAGTGPSEVGPDFEEFLDRLFDEELTRTREMSSPLLIDPSVSRYAPRALDRDSLESFGLKHGILDNVWDWLNPAKGLFDLTDEGVKKRLPLLLKALRRLQDRDSFDQAVETEEYYMKEAEQLADFGFKYAVFGHSHLAKKVPFGSGHTYFNTGTWCNLMKVPEVVYESDNDEVALKVLGEFAHAVRNGEQPDWFGCRLTYVRLDCSADSTEADLYTYYDDLPKD